MLLQLDDGHEIKHYDTFRSVVEMCKASGVDLSLLCTANIDMAMKDLFVKSKINLNGSFKYGVYLKLNDDGQALVNKTTEEFFLSITFLLLASNNIYSGSKHELVNDMVQGEDKLP